jgi:hypothetical protein
VSLEFRSADAAAPFERDADEFIDAGGGAKRTDHPRDRVT